jgi:hypothetical protein
VNRFAEYSPLDCLDTGLRLRVVPVSLAEANAFVALLHRHHKPVQGHKFSIGCACQDRKLRGVAIVGRPVARMTDHNEVLEVTRLCTDGTPNACSKLYSAAARVAREMGYSSIQTFVLETEPGTSLKAAGFSLSHVSAGGQWKHTDGRPRRTDQPTCPKHCWKKRLTPPY